MPPSQIGVAPEQSALATQRTQVPEPTSQTGVAPVHATALPAEHWPHRPLDWQAGVAPPHSLSPPQARQVRNAGSQIGVVPPQSALTRHPTQAFVLVLQTGVTPEQCALDRHCTQAGTGVSQIGVAPEQTPMFVAEQTPQAPDPWQAGALAGHCPSAAHAWQVWVPVLQIGVVPEQFVFDRHATQTRGETVVRQSGVAPLQSLDCAHCSTKHVRRLSARRRRRCRRSGSPARASPTGRAPVAIALVADGAQRRRVDGHAKRDRRGYAGRQAAARRRGRARAQPHPHRARGGDVFALVVAG